jgi:Sortase domain
VVGLVATGALVLGAVTASSIHSSHQPSTTAPPPLALGGAGRPAVAHPSATPQFGDVSQITASGSLLLIPALGVRAPLIPTGAVGAPETASLTIPANIHTVGWWDGTVSDGNSIVRENAPAPGQPGVAVIAGHIDSQSAAGALFNLDALKVGATIEVSDSTGRLSTWTVEAPPQTVRKTQLPAQLWATTGPPQIAVVTCGGPFDAATGHYADNVIVWARQTKS